MQKKYCLENEKGEEIKGSEWYCNFREEKCEKEIHKIYLRISENGRNIILLIHNDFKKEMNSPKSFKKDNAINKTVQNSVFKNFCLNGDSELVSDVLHFLPRENQTASLALQVLKLREKNPKDYLNEDFVGNFDSWTGYRAADVAYELISDININTDHKYQKLEKKANDRIIALSCLAKFEQGLEYDQEPVIEKELTI